MSYPDENFNGPNPEIGVDQLPQSAQNQAPHLGSNFVDGSGQIFSMYLEMATEEDKKMVENWKADADGILIFTGLFSAAVASLISVSIQDIRQNPQDTSNFYLGNIYQTLADPNGSTISSSLPASPPPFSPPNYAVWVNALWFLSLVISLTCALLATLLQQWARQYLKITQPRYSLHKRARIRAFFAEGVEKCLLQWAVETLPTLLHIVTVARPLGPKSYLLCSSRISRNVRTTEISKSRLASSFLSPHVLLVLNHHLVVLCPLFLIPPRPLRRRRMSLDRPTLPLVATNPSNCDDDDLKAFLFHHLATHRPPLRRSLPPAVPSPSADQHRARTLCRVQMF
ncbi:hypothetical protein V8E53_003087 [Lactarius tabidus]